MQIYYALIQFRTLAEFFLPFKNTSRKGLAGFSPHFRQLDLFRSLKISMGFFSCAIIYLLMKGGFVIIFFRIFVNYSKPSFLLFILPL